MWMVQVCQCGLWATTKCIHIKVYCDFTSEPTRLNLCPYHDFDGQNKVILFCAKPLNVSVGVRYKMRWTQRHPRTRKTIKTDGTPKTTTTMNGGRNGGNSRRTQIYRYIFLHWFTQRCSLHITHAYSIRVKIAIENSDDCFVSCALMTVCRQRKIHIRSEYKHIGIQ